ADVERGAQVDGRRRQPGGLVGVVEDVAARGGDGDGVGGRHAPQDDVARHLEGDVGGEDGAVGGGDGVVVGVGDPGEQADGAGDREVGADGGAGLDDDAVAGGEGDVAAGGADGDAAVDGQVVVGRGQRRRLGALRGGQVDVAAHGDVAGHRQR